MPPYQVLGEGTYILTLVLTDLQGTLLASEAIGMLAMEMRQLMEWEDVRITVERIDRN